MTNEGGKTDKRSSLKKGLRSLRKNLGKEIEKRRMQEGGTFYTKRIFIGPEANRTIHLQKGNRETAKTEERGGNSHSLGLRGGF